MNKLKLISLMSIFIICTNCSVNKNNQPANDFDSKEFAIEDRFFIEAVRNANLPPKEFTPAPTTNLEARRLNIPEAQKMRAPAEAPAEIVKNDSGVYEVRRGDTWMIISQKLLGNPLRWREIQRMNKEFKRSSDLYVGAKLTYTPPEKPIVEPEGLPYLIKNADTLPKISTKVYGTKQQWGVIYFNNRDTIKSPDLIYTGFVIYYPEAEKVPMVKIQMAEMNFNTKSPRRPASVVKANN